MDARRRLLAEPWPPTVPLRVRMGIHVAAAQERDGDYFGPALNRAARLLADLPWPTTSLVGRQDALDRLS